MTAGLFGDLRPPDQSLDGVHPWQVPGVTDGRRLWVRHEQDREHAGAAAAVNEAASRTSLVGLLGIDLGIRLRAGLELRTVADLAALVMDYREKELWSVALLNPAEAVKVVRALSLWWEPRFLAELAVLRGVARPDIPPPPGPAAEATRPKKRERATKPAAPMQATFAFSSEEP